MIARACSHFLYEMKFFCLFVFIVLGILGEARVIVENEKLCPDCRNPMKIPPVLNKAEETSMTYLLSGIKQ